MALYTIKEAHGLILLEAEAEANHEIESLDWGVAGRLFHLSSVQSERAGMTLAIDRVLGDTLTDEQLEIARKIAMRAIVGAIQKNKEGFMGLIVGEARNGRNYFDRFRTDAENSER